VAGVPMSRPASNGWLLVVAAVALACGGGAGTDAVPGDDVPGLDTPGDTLEPVDTAPADLPPLDDLAPDVLPPQATLQLEAPGAVRPGEPFPVIVRLLTVEGAPDVATSGTITLEDAATGAALGDVRLWHGVGSVEARVASAGQVVLRASVGPIVGTRTLTVQAAPSPRELEGELSGADLAWGPGAAVRLVGDAIVPAGRTLTVAAGVTVRGTVAANLIVRGHLVVEGTADLPAWFTADGDTPWGGVVHEAAPGTYAHALFTRGGGDAARQFGHSHSQPVLFVKQATVTLDGVAFLDNAGKGPSGDRATYVLTGGLVTRCDTGGEWESSAVTVRDSWVLEMPSADGQPADDDNDGIYLHLSLPGADGQPVASRVERSVFAVGKDDGIDQNGATLVVQRVLLAGFAHEGLATSNKGRVEATSVLATRCEQGFEVGYSADDPDPLHLVLDHVVATDNDVGFRLGDSYDKDVVGTLTVTNSIATGNRLHNVWNHVNKLDGPLEGHLSISTCMVDDSAWNGTNGNLPGTPTFDASWHLVPGTTGTGAASDGSDLGLLP